MGFTSVVFVPFFLAFYLVYRLLPRAPQNWLLLAASYAFYAAWDWRFLGLVVATTGVNYACGLAMAGEASDRRRRVLLVVAVAFGLSVLGAFKYFGFFADNLRALAALAGWHLDAPTLQVGLPFGISFYTFMAMSYIVDVYRRQIEPTRTLRDFAVFVAFFPTLLAGPIMRAGQMLPQLAARREIGAARVREGLWLVLWGVAKKVVVADNLAKIAGAVFAPGADPTGFEVLLGVYAFAFQIYGDFSGYTDIARGLAALMGFDLPVNFRFPYFVTSPQAFWQHWHITLSTWLRDYLFLPLAYAWSRRLDGVRWLGFRDDVWTYAAATMVTMVLAGLWHGAAWPFVVWGVYQGALLTAFRFASVAAKRQKRRAAAARHPDGGSPNLAVAAGGGVGRRRWLPGRGGLVRTAPAMAAMFHLTCLGWLVFRAASLEEAGRLLARAVTGFAPSMASWHEHGWPLLFYAAPLVVVHGLEAWRDDLLAVLKLPALARDLVVGVLLYLVLLFGDFAGAQFIYVQF